MLDQDWRTRIECSDSLELFDTAISHTHPDRLFARKTALRICARCEVRLECLVDALRTDDQHAIRGGLTARERRRLRRAKSAA